MKEDCKFSHPEIEGEDLKKKNCDRGNQCSRKHSSRKRIKLTYTRSRKNEPRMGKEPRTEQWIKAAKEGTKNQNGSLVGKTEGNNQIQREHADQEHGTLLNQMQ